MSYLRKGQVQGRQDSLPPKTQTVLVPPFTSHLQGRAMLREDRSSQRWLCSTAHSSRSTVGPEPHPGAPPRRHLQAGPHGPRALSRSLASAAQEGRGPHPPEPRGAPRELLPCPGALLSPPPISLGPSTGQRGPWQRPSTRWEHRRAWALRHEPGCSN